MEFLSRFRPIKRRGRERKLEREKKRKRKSKTCRGEGFFLSFRTPATIIWGIFAFPHNRAR